VLTPFFGEPSVAVAVITIDGFADNLVGFGDAAKVDFELIGVA
jgi:hypothetical protein